MKQPIALLRPFLKPIVATLCSFASVVPSFAETSGFEWGGNSYVASGSSTFLLPEPIDSGGDRTYSYSSTPISRTTGYDGPSIHGVLQNSVGTTPVNFNTAAVTRRPNGANWILIEGSNDSTVARSISGLIYFTKDDFLNGYSEASNITFDEASSLSMRVENLPSGSPREVHFAVRSGDNWYLSSARITGTSTFSLLELPDSKWALWDPALTPLDSFPSSTDYTILGSDLVDIQAVGFTFANGIGVGSTQRPTIAVSAFSANFAPIPEPSVIAILGFGSLLFLKPLFNSKRRL